ncbi:MAG TPA: VanZ family protein [Syntrophomonas sp.]|nr:VanZ family protein [Syntrophomonas sp.]HRW11866.1 VanZ family protein [Syntrophomonas sp.]
MIRYKKLFFWLPVLIWTGSLFFFSSQTADESTRLSGEMIRTLLVFIRPEFLQMTAAQQAQWVASLQHLVRNAAHFGSYFVLAMLCMIALRQYPWRLARQAALTLLLCMGYALTDELHQLFVAGRAFEMVDLGLDLGGTLLGLAVMLVIAGEKQSHIKRQAPR